MGVRYSLVLLFFVVCMTGFGSSVIYREAPVAPGTLVSMAAALPERDAMPGVAFTLTFGASDAESSQPREPFALAGLGDGPRFRVNLRSGSVQLSSLDAIPAEDPGLLLAASGGLFLVGLMLQAMVENWRREMEATRKRRHRQRRHRRSSLSQRATASQQ